jgi:hypothetical protein
MDHQPACYSCRNTRPGIIATIATTVFIANTPGANRMILPGRDHLPLQPHRAVERELHRFIGFKGFGVDKKAAVFPA